jgi:acyl-CoA synthetase (AMP-forming)/AMP-acid ligase II
MLTIYQLLKTATQAFPDKPYVITGGATYSYKTFLAGVNQLSEGLKDLGVKKGDHVAMFLTNGIEFLYTMFALGRIGAVFVPFNTALRSDELFYVLEHSESTVLITNTDLYPAVKEIGRPKLLEKIVCTGEVAEGDVVAFNDLFLDRAGEDGGVTADDMASIMYTSGTTGKPKGVLLINHAYVYTANAYVDHLGWNAQDNVICMLPLFHINAQVYSTLATLAARGTMVLQESFSASTFWDQVREYNITVFITMPTVSLILFNEEAKPTDADNPVRQVITALPPAIYEKFEERYGLEVISGYSLTENMLPFFNPLERDKRNIRTIGKPITPDCRVKIFDPDDNEMPADGPGEIVIQSPAVMKGYFKNPEETTKAMKNDWLHTGDFGKIDADGFIYFVDRKKDIVRRGGENIASMEVEGVLNTHPKVVLSAIIPVPDPIYEEEVKAYIIPADKSVTVEELAEHAEANLAFFKRPRYYEFRDDLPKTPSMRVQKNVLKAEKEDLIAGSTDVGKRKKKS